MVNVYFFDLRDGGTDFEKLSDDQFILWDKKSKNMNLGDLCIIYNYKEKIIITSKVESDKIYPQQEGDNWFVEYLGKKYYFSSNGQFEEFVAFKEINRYETSEDFKVSAQGGLTLLNQKGDTEFKKHKLEKVLKIIHKDKEILQILNKYSPKTIIDSIIDSLELHGELTKEEIYADIQLKKSYTFGAEDPIDVIRIQLDRHCKNSNRSDKANTEIFYKNIQKYGLLSKRNTSSKWVDLLSIKKQIVLYGPPGTGKTYVTKKLALELIENG